MLPIQGKFKSSMGRDYEPRPADFETIVAMGVLMPLMQGRQFHVNNGISTLPISKEGELCGK